MQNGLRLQQGGSVAEFVMASECEYRGADGGQEHPYMQNVRANWPGPKHVVQTDVDQIIRRYSNDNPKGTFILIEYKHGDQLQMTGGQSNTLGLLDELCRKSDLKSAHYRGLFLINYEQNSNGDFVPLKVTKVTRHLQRVVLDRPTLEQFNFYLWELLDPKPFDAL